MARLSRRDLFKGAMGVGAGVAVAATGFHPRQAHAASFSRVVDLTHTMGEDFPTYFGEPQLTIEVLNSFDPDGFNMKKWTLVEHTGTHLDAPFHFSADGWSSDQIPAENLVARLAIVDISAKAEDDPDAQVTPDDLAAFESENGEIVEGSVVAMMSGWDRHVASEKFRNADSDGVMHFPGFHVEAADMMIERGVVGMVVDTLSLDYGMSGDFATHYKWLPSGRWGIENAAGLGELPATGATIVVGAPKIAGATGGPTRLMALV